MPPEHSDGSSETRSAAGAMRLPEFVHNLFPLEDRLVGMGVRSAQQEGRTVSCRAGCGACCRQPVPVSLPEAFLLYEVVAGQPLEQRERTLARFEAAKEVLQANGFGDRFKAFQFRDEISCFSLLIRT